MPIKIIIGMGSEPESGALKGCKVAYGYWRPNNFSQVPFQPNLRFRIAVSRCKYMLLQFQK
jgi:hypothetical protein